MEITVEQFNQRFDQFDRRLQTLEQGQQSLEQGQQSLEQRLEREISGIKQMIVDSQAKIIQWVVGLFIGSTVIIATLAGVYITVAVHLAR